MLKGIRIVDFTQYLPGPHATLRLVEMGAEVIKVESPLGDPSRPVTGKKEEGLIFLAQNRDKKSVVLNLKDAEDQKVALNLIADSDVVVEGFRPGVVSRIGIGYEDVKKVKPDIIYCSITGYGQIGEMSKMGGHDINYLSLSGVLSQFKDEKGRPVLPSTTVADIIAGIAASEAILGALVKKLQTGEGSYIDLSITDSTLSLMSNHTVVESVTGEENGIANLNSKLICYNLYETKDGRYVSLGALEPKFWHNFCNALEKAHWIPAHYSAADVENPIFAELKSVFLSKTLAEWIEFSKVVDCCLTPVLETSELHLHSLFKERSMIAEKDGIRYTSTRLSPVNDITKQKDSPELGQHTNELLSIYKNKKLNLEHLSNTSIYEMLENTSMKFPSQKAVTDSTITLTYTQLLAKVDCFASLLVFKGFKKGDRIGLMLPNGIHKTIAYYAVLRLGGTVVQVNPYSETSELDYIIEDASPKWFISQREQSEKIEKFAGINVVYTTDEKGKDQVITYEKFGELPVVKINSKEDVAIIQYANDETGKLNSTLITHFDILSKIYQGDGVFENIVEGKELILGLAPINM